MPLLNRLGVGKKKKEKKKILFLRHAIAWKKEQKTSDKSEAGSKSPEHLLDARRVPDLARNLKKTRQKPSHRLRDSSRRALASPTPRSRRTTPRQTEPRALGADDGDGTLNRPRHKAPVGGGITHSLSKGACGTPPKVARVARPVARPPLGGEQGGS